MWRACRPSFGVLAFAVAVAGGELAAPARAGAQPPPIKAIVVQKEPAVVLPEPGLRARILAPSLQGPWTLRLENEGSVWLRVPADLRLLHITVESGDTLGRRAERPVKCSLPGPLHVTSFPEPNALLLGPGDAYVETFDPHLFCFGKDAKLLAGGAVVHATYGFPGHAGGRKVEGPFVAEGTTFPADVRPKKELVLPSFVMSWLPPDHAFLAPPVPADHETAPPEEAMLETAAAPPPADLAKPGTPAPISPGAKAPTEEAALPHTAPPPKPPVDEGGLTRPAERPLPPPRPPVDENAARFELRARPYEDAAVGHNVTLSVTVTNVGHRAGTAAIRPGMLSFRVEGPDGVVDCPQEPPIAIGRDEFETLRPNASRSFTVLVDEACGQEVFPRPGLYRLLPSLHLRASGSAFGLAAITGTVRAHEPMSIRVADGPSPFYRRKPEVTHAAHGDAR